MKMLPYQCKAARALLGWTQAELANRAHVTVDIVDSFESQGSIGPGTKVFSSKNAHHYQAKYTDTASLQSVFEQIGIEFTLEGARLKKSDAPA